RPGRVWWSRSPVKLSGGERNSPSDCRAPIVTIRMAAAASVIVHAVRAPAGGVVTPMRDGGLTQIREQRRADLALHQRILGGAPLGGREILEPRDLSPGQRGD